MNRLAQRACAALCVVGTMGATVVVPAQPAAAAFSDQVSAGPQPDQTALLPPPYGLSAGTAGCPDQPGSLGVPLSWVGSSALDADGNYMVGYYGILRSVNGGAYTLAGDGAGLPAPTAYTDDSSVDPLPTTTYFATQGDSLVASYHASSPSPWTVMGNYDFGPEENLLAATPDGTALYAAESGGPGGNVVVVGAVYGSSNYGQVLSTITLAGAGAQPIAVAMAPNGTAAYVLDGANDQVDVVPVPTPGPTYTVTTTVPVGDVGDPAAMALTPGSSQLLVANYNSGTVTVIDTATDSVSGTVPLYQPDAGPAYLPQPMGMVVAPSGTDAFVVDRNNNLVDEIALAGAGTGTVVADIAVGDQGGVDTPADIDVAGNAAGAEVYVGNGGASTVSAINVTTLAVTTMAVGGPGQAPVAVAAATNGCVVGVATSGGANVTSFIGTSTGTVIGTQVGTPATSLAGQAGPGSYEQADGSVVAVPTVVSYEVQAAQTTSGAGFKSTVSPPVTVSLGRGQLP